MTEHRLRARVACVFTVARGAGLIASVSLGSTAIAEEPGRAKLSKEDRQRLATAAANRTSTVTMLFATVETSTGSVANALRALGATVRKTDADVGYIRADVPTDKAEAAAKLPGVVASELDQVFSIVPPDAGEGTGPTATPSETTPAQN